MGSQWIKATDRLPPEDKDVLVFAGEDMQIPDIGRLINGNWRTNYDLTKYREITHWAEIPDYSHIQDLSKRED